MPFPLREYEEDPEHQILEGKVVTGIGGHPPQLLT
jgi:hypothetical protein